LREADRNGDGVVSEDEFTEAMCNMIRKSLKLKKLSPQANAER
jgi:hypothetical protein